MKLAIGIILFSVVLEMVLLLRMIRLKKQEKTQYEKSEVFFIEIRKSQAFIRYGDF